MTQANVELVRGVWDAFARGDASGALDAFSDEVELDISRDVWGDVVGGGHYVGIEGITTFMRDLYEAWEQFDMRCEEVIDTGDDQVVSVLTARGRGRVSGIDVEHHPAGVGTLRAGKVVRMVWFSSRADALKAVGLSE